MSNEIWNDAVHALEAKEYGLARTLFASLKENKEAQLQLGYLYQEGLGGKINRDKAQEIFQSLANAGDSQGMYFLAKCLLMSKSLSEATQYFEKAAQLGHVSGAYWAAVLHGGQYECQKDLHKHRYFLEMAVHLGHLYAKRDLALEDAIAANNFLLKGAAYLRYFAALMKGVALTFRNRHDFRIR